MEDLGLHDEYEPRKPTGLSARLPLLNIFRLWLVGVFHTSKEELNNAGVYLGGEGRD